MECCGTFFSEPSSLYLQVYLNFYSFRVDLSVGSEEGASGGGRHDVRFNGVQLTGTFPRRACGVRLKIMLPVTGA